MKLRAPFDLDTVQATVDRVNDAVSERRHAFEMIHYQREHGSDTAYFASIAKYHKANSAYKDAVAEWESLNA